jgi:metalloprotein, YbeY family
MTIDISYETDIELDIPYEDIIRQMVVAALDYENCPYEAEVSVTVVDDKEIQKINKTYRNIDKATDVLSFPMYQYEKAADFDNLDDSAFNPESGELLLGDIVISAEKVTAQAKEYGHSKEREFAFLLVHSMLHLLGYDHMEEEERLVMESKQKEILELNDYKR